MKIKFRPAGDPVATRAGLIYSFCSLEENSMATRLNPYLNFRGQAREALNFYQAALGGTLVMDTFGGFGVPLETPGETEWIMHGQLETAAGFTLMASDTPSSLNLVVGSNVSISLSGDDAEELKGYWDKLSEGAHISMPLRPAPWGDQFGALTDKFGINWLVNIAGAPQQQH